MTTAADWNRKHGSGSPVRCKPKTKANPLSFPVDTVTRSSAITNSRGRAIVLLKGVEGYVPLAEIEALPQPAEAVQQSGAGAYGYPYGMGP